MLEKKGKKDINVGGITARPGKADLQFDSPQPETLFPRSVPSFPLRSIVSFSVWIGSEVHLLRHWGNRFELMEGIATIRLPAVIGACLGIRRTG